jgi:hypothetical protein
MATRSRYIDTAECAKLIRQALKDAFPGVRFSVRSKRYSGGSSITVHWTDGPVTREVEPLVRRFQGASFDGMTDLKEYHDSTFNGERVHFGADYVFTSREMSDDRRAELVAKIEAATGRPFGRDERYSEPVIIEGRWYHGAGFYGGTLYGSDLLHQVFGEIGRPYEAGDAFDETTAEVALATEPAGELTCMGCGNQYVPAREDQIRCDHCAIIRAGFTPVDQPSSVQFRLMPADAVGTLPTLPEFSPEELARLAFYRVIRTQLHTEEWKA